MWKVVTRIHRKKDGMRPAMSTIGLCSVRAGMEKVSTVPVVDDDNDVSLGGAYSE